MDDPDRHEGTAAATFLRDFVNTLEPQVEREELLTPAAVSAWFEAQGLSPGRLGGHHLQLAVDVREGLRALFLEHAGHDGDVQAVERLNQVLAQFPVSLALDPDSYALSPGTADPFAGPMAAVADAIRQCHEDGSWPRLKVCARDTCHWAFYDASRNKVRRWCSMAGCGNHIKMKRAYARRTTSH